jgi:hypothetical protein
MKYDKGHPYAFRTWIRQYLPWFLINLGIANKKEDCTKIGGKHFWYCQDENTSACYHCEVVKPGKLWKDSEEIV